jgi:hypothetical protein
MVASNPASNILHVDRQDKLRNIVVNFLALDNNHMVIVVVVALVVVALGEDSAI